MVDILLMWIANFLILLILTGICNGIRAVTQWLQEKITVGQLLIGLSVVSGVFSVAYYMGMTYG